MAPAKAEIPACPKCGAMTWQFDSRFVGIFRWLVDAAGWHDEDHEPDDLQDDQWVITCHGCWHEWSDEDEGDKGDVGYKLREALGEIYQEQMTREIAKKERAKREKAKREKAAAKD